MQEELIRLVVEVFGILVIVGGLGGVLRLGYNYIQQALGKEDALVEGIKNVVAATVWIILVPTLLMIMIQFAKLISFDVSIDAVVRSLGGTLQ